ncbi:MAG: undecaprenyl-phosphate glucose phosphotransferase [Alphaproteobacteria bacterium]|nr:undecaprenyl-phosphate glucose phosphotransferase [Alphaproteobacteria bacterium]
MASEQSFLGLDNQRVLVGLLRFADVFIVGTTGIVSYWIRHGTDQVPEEYLVGIAIGALLTANYMQIARLYEFSGFRRFAAQAGTLTACWAAVMVTLMVIAYFGKVSEEFSRVWVVSWFIASYLALATLRAVIALVLERLTRTGRLTFNIAVVGAGEYGQRLIEHLDRQTGRGVKIIGVFDDRKTRIPDTVAGYPVIGTVNDLLLFARSHDIDQVAIALPWSAEEHLTDIFRKLRTLAVDVKLCPGAIAFELPNLGYNDIAGVPMLTMIEPPLTGWNTLAKGIEDRVLALLLLILFSPVMLAAAVGIRLSGPGPVFFRQRRYGFNSNEITVLKFRTMHWNSPQTDDAEGKEETTPQAERDDPRITAIGRILRRASLDELPQLVNVLRGEMSLVGPRPHAVAHNLQYAPIIDEYLGRHRVKPGITGWAQVNGLRGETRTPELMRRRVQYDLYYIEHWSLLFDLRILLLTPFVGFVHENAY